MLQGVSEGFRVEKEDVLQPVGVESLNDLGGCLEEGDGTIVVDAGRFVLVFV